MVEFREANIKYKQQVKIILRNCILGLEWF